MKKFFYLMIASAFLVSLSLVSSQAADQPVADQAAAQTAAPAEKPAAPADVAAENTSAPAGSMEVVEIAIAKSIQDRTPQEVADTFTPDIARLYCYTKVTGGKEGDTIVHRWKKGGEVMGEMTLKVNASPWRTFSSKGILKEWTGPWTVEILQGETVLKSKEFTIQ